MHDNIYISSYLLLKIQYEFNYVFTIEVYFQRVLSLYQFTLEGTIKKVSYCSILKSIEIVYILLYC